jgi:ABC-type nitrate/sulfonate/bicarbonate transport system substrate-binding protein
VRVSKCQPFNLLAVLIPVSLLVVACSTPAAPNAQGKPAGPATKVRFAQTGASASQWNYYIAKDKGFFTRNGLDVEFITGNNAQTVYQQVLANAAEFGVTGLPQGILAVDSGAKIKLIGGSTSVPSYRVAVGKDIKTWADLKGKTISLGGPNDVTYYFWKLLLDKQGLSLSDFNYVWAGATTDRFAALKANSIAGTLLLQPFDFQAESEGFPMLGTLTDVLSPDQYVFTGAWVKSDWATANAETIVSLIKAQNEATAWMYDPAHADEVKAVLQAYVPSTPDIINKTYDLLIKGYQFFPKLSDLPEPAMQNVIKSLVVVDAIKTEIPQATFIDRQYVDKAAKS